MFYSKNYSDKESGIRSLKQELETYAHSNDNNHTPNQVCRAASTLLERAIKDKVFSVFSLANDLLLTILTDFIKKNRWDLESLSKKKKRNRLLFHDTTVFKFVNAKFVRSFNYKILPPLRFKCHIVSLADSVWYCLLPWMMGIWQTLWIDCMITDLPCQKAVSYGVS